MNNTFWSNTIWYILVGVITAVELSVIFIKVKNRRRTLAFFLTISGLTFSLEMVVYSYFKGYQYFPMLFVNSPPDDSIAGNIFSQFFISATALLIAVFYLRFYWFIVFAAAIAAVEELFITLGIYKQNWYQTWMTILGLLLIFWTVKKIYIMKIYINTIDFIGCRWRYLLIYLGLVTMHELSIIWPQRLLGIRLFSETFLPDKEQSLVVLSAINMVFLGIIIMMLYFSNIKWRWRITAIITLYIVCFIAAKCNLILYKAGWFLISTSICIWGMYLYTYILDKLYGHNICRTVEKVKDHAR